MLKNAVKTGVQGHVAFAKKIRIALLYPWLEEQDNSENIDNYSDDLDDDDDAVLHWIVSWVIVWCVTFISSWFGFQTPCNWVTCVPCAANLHLINAKEPAAGRSWTWHLTAGNVQFCKSCPHYPRFACVLCRLCSSVYSLLASPGEKYLALPVCYVDCVAQFTRC